MIAESQGRNESTEAHVEVEVVDTSEGLSRLSPAWHVLAQGCATPFQTFAWNMTWWDLIGSRSVGTRLHVLVVRVDSVVAAIAPFMIHKGCLGFLSSPWNDYGDVLVATHTERARAAVAALWCYLRWAVDQRIARVELAEVPPWSVLLIDSASPNDDVAQLVPGSSVDASVCPRRDLRGDVRPSRNLRRKANVLARRGELSHTIRTRPTELVQLMPEFMAMHVRQWYGRPDCGLTFTQPDMMYFYRESIVPLAAAGLLAVVELRVGGVAAAFDFGFLHGSTFFSWRPAFETNFADGSPGTVMHGMAFGTLAAAGYLTYDFMRGDFAYKRRYADMNPVNRTIHLTVPAF